MLAAACLLKVYSPYLTGGKREIGSVRLFQINSGSIGLVSGRLSLCILLSPYVAVLPKARLAADFPSSYRTSNEASDTCRNGARFFL